MTKKPIEIQSNIPLPSRRRAAKWLFPFDKLEKEGQSFAVPLDDRHMLSQAVYRWRKAHPGWNLTIRTNAAECRVWRIAAILALILAATPAFAWTNTNHGHNNQIVDGGPGAQANAHQAQGQAQRQAQHATGGTANVTTSNSVAVLSGGNSGGGARIAPDVTLPSFGGGGMDCPTVGFGAGGSGLGGGGGFGPSWISSDCNKRRVASLLATLYGPAVARAYAEKNIDGVREAVAAANTNSHQDYPFDWCYTRDAGSMRQREVCEGKR